jgi:hypothetical protein
MFTPTSILENLTDLDQYRDTASACGEALGVSSGTILWRIKHWPDQWFYTREKEHD